MGETKLRDNGINTHTYIKGGGGGWLPVRKGAGTTLIDGTTDWFPQVPREGGVRKEEAGVRTGPIEVGVIQLLLRLK